MPRADIAVTSSPIDDLRHGSRLIIDAVRGVTDTVENLHRTIGRVEPITGPVVRGRTRGITGLVYRSIRGVTSAVGMGLDVSLGRLGPLLRTETTSPRRDALVAILNGILGDYLRDSGNPLAIDMQLRQHEQTLMLDRAALAGRFPQAGGKLLLMLHGLCMNDRQWLRDGRDYGASLAAELGYTPLYLVYNSGRNVSDNGRDLCEQLQRLVDAWPVPVSELSILAHSMGGLVSRSALHHAQVGDYSWPEVFGSLICLGTPHHGASLERAGNWVTSVASASPYSAPLGRIGALRSAGIKDLRRGSVSENDDVSSEHPHANATPFVALPDGLRCFVLAGSRQKHPTRAARSPLGDGLVSVSSALGQHRDPARCLQVPESHRAVCYGVNHMQLLSSDAVYQQVGAWMHS